MKQKLMEEYQARLKDRSLDEKEREALMNELNAKLSHINSLAADEHDKQNHHLQQMLLLR